MKISTVLNRTAQLLTVVVLYASFTPNLLANQRDEIILYMNDPLGSAIAAFDEQGEVCWEEIHTPYGDKTVMEDSFNRQGCGVVTEERGFTGHSEDFETDLVYMQQRYYDPTIGRFLSIDPVGPIAGDSRTINRYSYAANNPYKYVDPDGRFFFGSNIFRKDLSPEQALEISAASNAALASGLGSTAIAATIAVPGPEDFAAGAIAFRGLRSLEKASETIDGSKSTVQLNKAAGDAARDSIAARTGGAIEQNFHVTGGLRRVDVLSNGTAIESKVGRTSLTQRTRQELARDVKLLRTGQVDRVQWEFTRSSVTGKSGPSGPLRQKLKKFEIDIVE